MKRAQDRVHAARPYANALADVISSLYTPELAEQFPLLRQPAKPRRAAVILLNSNRGLAGGFNANLIKEARAQLQRLRAQGIETELHVSGRKGIGYFRYLGEPLAAARTDITDRPTAEDAASLVDALMQRFVDGSLDAVYVVYAHFKSVLHCPPTTTQVLPVVPPERTGPAPDYLLFPSAAEILTELLPSYVRNTLYRTLVETAAAEHIARRTAMKNATDNATSCCRCIAGPIIAPVRRKSRRKLPRSSAVPRRSSSSQKTRRREDESLPSNTRSSSCKPSLLVFSSSRLLVF